MVSRLYFDSHAHLSSDEVLPQIDAVLARARVAQVKRILNICTNPRNLRTGLELEKKHPGTIRNAGATTPHDVEKEGEEAFPVFAAAVRGNQLAAVGETGLDYHYEHSDRQKQKEFLVRYLHLALECSVPVIFHCREAFDDLFAIADAEYTKGAPAILHCFTGTVEEAKEVVRRGWFVSLSGIVTFKKSESLREASRIIPLGQLLIETDSPYLAPQSKRGKQNEPAFIIETALCVAEAKGISVDEVAKSTFENGSRLFGF